MKIWFDSFWGLFDKQDNIFVWILKKITDVEITPDNPDIIFTDNRNYIKTGTAKVIYYSGEPFFNIGQCDCALTSFNVDDPRFFRLPLYTLYAYDLYKHGVIKSYNDVINKQYSSLLLQEKTKDFAYISQGAGGNCPRENLINFLKQHIQIDCAGNHLNNQPTIEGEPGTIYGSINKINFLKSYKFAFAIENNDNFNSSYGYTTEKIFEPMVANCIPIYWGNPNINDEFNKDSFINIKEFENYEDLLSKLIDIMDNNKLYIDYVMQPYIYYNKYFDIDYLVDLFREICF